MLSLAGSHPGGCEIAAFAQIRRTPSRIMSIRGENADVPLVQHPLRPISRISTEGARERPRRDLHPDAGSGEPPDRIVVGGDPREALGMRQDRNVAGRQNSKKELLQPGGRHVMRGLDENVAGVGERQQMTCRKTPDEVGHHVIVRTRNELQRNAFLIEDGLQLPDGIADLRTAVMVKTWQDMRRAGDMGDAVGHERPRHIERNRQVAGTVVDTRQNMTMQIDHEPRSPRSSRLRGIGRSQRTKSTCQPSGRAPRTFRPQSIVNRRLQALHISIHYG